MREVTVISILVGFFIIAGLFVFFQSDGGSYSEFNFHSANLVLNEAQVDETLTFRPDKRYHTLYRNFESPVYAVGSSVSSGQHILVNNVICSEGTPYVRDKSSRCTVFQDQVIKSDCMAYTENNEYGCTFGNSLGFNYGGTYSIGATYNLNPDKLFLINGLYYFKFVAYSRNNHVTLDSSNFKVIGNHVKKEKYPFYESVIIYIPYRGDTSSFTVKKLNDFSYDSNPWNFILPLFFSLLPAIIIFGIWRFFGKEKTYDDIPLELSFYPKERKPWEVAAFFQPPFNLLDKNFFATMLINFYHKKIIDIKMKKKDVMIKINEHRKENLDGIEKDFLLILESLFIKDPAKVVKKGGKYSFAESLAKFEKNFFSSLFGSKSFIDESGYLNLKKALGSTRNRSYIRLSFKALHEDVKKIGKKYINSAGKHIAFVIAIALVVIAKLGGIILIGVNTYAIFLYVALLLVLIFFNRTALFLRFKEHYYKEYQRWQAYRKFLKNSFSIKAHGHKGVILWDKILVYATSLGVAKQVLKEMKKIGVITEEYYVIYNGVYVSSGSFSASTGAAGAAGGGGGMGGGVGGGGGGGR